MSSPEFVFSLRLAGREQFDHVLAEVAATVFRHVGCAAAVVVELVDQLNAVVTPALDSEFDVQFRARADTFEVVVFSRSREIWRSSRQMTP